MSHTLFSFDGKLSADASLARVHLARIPFVRLSHFLPPGVHTGETRPIRETGSSPITHPRRMPSWGWHGDIHECALPRGPVCIEVLALIAEVLGKPVLMANDQVSMPVSAILYIDPEGFRRGGRERACKLATPGTPTHRRHTTLESIEFKADGNPTIARWQARRLADLHQVIGVTCKLIDHLIDEESWSLHKQHCTEISHDQR